MNAPIYDFKIDPATVVRSPKCRTPIPVFGALHRDAIIQAIFDPKARSIEFLSCLRHQHTSVAVNGAVVHGDGGAYLIDISGHRLTRTFEEESAIYAALRSHAISVRVMDDRDIMTEPLLGNAREVWTCRNVKLPLRDRFRILAALDEEGPLSIMALQEFVCVSVDLATAVCTLACADLVEIDLLSGPLGPTTIVRCRA